MSSRNTNKVDIRRHSREGGNPPTIVISNYFRIFAKQTRLIMKKITTIFFAIILGIGVFAQPLQLRPEVVELYRLQDIALRSRILNSDDFIEKHKAFFNHPLFCENAFGFEYLNFARMLLRQGEYTMAREYFLKSARLRYVNTSSAFEMIFRSRMQTWPDTIYTIPRTPENMRFRETMLKKILEIEKICPRIVAIAQEISEMVERDQAVRRTEEIFIEYGRRVDSINIHRIIELIKENPDIDIMRVDILGGGLGRDFFINGTGSPTLILWHNLLQFPETWATFFEPYFRKRAEAGKGLDYVVWYDRQNFMLHQRETFGIFGFGATTRPFIFVADNLEEINENRARVGLLPLTRR